MTYLNYWRFREEPFKNALDERFVFMTPQHREGVARLTYAVQQRKGGALLTGDYGTGKSLVRKMFLSSLESVGNFAVALVENPLADPECMMRDMIAQLGGREVASAVVGAAFRDLSVVLAERHARGFHNLIVVEEAQLLSRIDRLEQLRLLMNLADGAGNALLTMVFIGQDDMLRTFARSPGLLQRLTSRWNIGPLTREQTRDYISHRLSIAGGNGWIIDDGASDALFGFSGGIARLINNAADMSLYLGMAENAVRVDARIVERVAADWSSGVPRKQEVTA